MLANILVINDEEETLSVCYMWVYFVIYQHKRCRYIIYNIIYNILVINDEEGTLSVVIYFLKIFIFCIHIRVKGGIHDKIWLEIERVLKSTE